MPFCYTIMILEVGSTPFVSGTELRGLNVAQNVTRNSRWMIRDARMERKLIVDQSNHRRALSTSQNCGLVGLFRVFGYCFRALAIIHLSIWLKNLFNRLNHKVDKWVQETQNQYAYFESVTYRQNGNYTDIYDGKMANCCQKVQGFFPIVWAVTDCKHPLLCSA